MAEIRAVAVGRSVESVASTRCLTSLGSKGPQTPRTLAWARDQGAACLSEILGWLVRDIFSLGEEREPS